MTEFTEGRHASEAVLSEASGGRSRDNITIESGAGIVAANTVLGVKSNGKYVPSTVAAADGAESASAMNLYEVDATAADVEVAGITGDAELNGNILTYAADVDLDAEKVAKNAELTTNSGIKVR